MNNQLETAEFNELTSESKRELVVSYALSHVGEQGYLQYLADTCPGKISRVAWCGIFCLHVLKEAGLAKDWNWILGKGFLFRLRRTLTPQPGDIVYIHSPFQHHAIVEDCELKSYRSIDGNQPDDSVCRRTRPYAGSVFYSIESLL